MNDAVRTRLGLDTLRIPLDRAATGPFGAPVSEILLPGHLAPKDKSGEWASVLAEDNGTIRLRYGEKLYTYSRFGLETIDESAD